MHPWQEMTVGCGLMLHAPLKIRVDPADLQADFAAIEAAATDDERYSRSPDGEWRAMTLVNRGVREHVAATPSRLLAYAPHIAAVLAQFGDGVIGCHISRQEPWGCLEWHFDNQTLYLEEGRLLLPIHVPAGARTLIGHESVAYPPGQMWAGDFAMPHQVENDSDEQRIVLLIDVTCSDAVRGLAPPELTADIPRRLALAQEGVNYLQAWRAERYAA